MTSSENTTKPLDVPVDGFIARVDRPARRAAAQVLDGMFRRATEELDRGLRHGR